MICNIFRVTFKDTFRVNTFKEFLFSLVFVDHKDSSHGHVLALKLGDLRWYLDSVHADRFKIRWEDDLRVILRQCGVGFKLCTCWGKEDASCFKSKHNMMAWLKLCPSLQRWNLLVISGTMMPHLQALFQLDKAYRLSLVVSFHRVIYISEGEKVLALNACLCVYFMASSSNFLQRKTWWW